LCVMSILKCMQVGHQKALSRLAKKTNGKRPQVTPYDMEVNDIEHIVVDRIEHTHWNESLYSNSRIVIETVPPALRGGHRNHRKGLRV